MKAAVDADSCRGHGICWSICPEVFHLTDDGYAEVLTPDVPAEHQEAARKAQGSCPERAITVS